MSSSFGEQIKISIFGQSHSEGIGVVVDGLPAGEKIDMEAVRQFMQRRAPGRQAFATARKEGDEPEVLSGLFEDMTCGAPLCAVIRNTNTRSQDYNQLKEIPRPAHADYPAMVRHRGYQDYRGGGHFSGRLTAPLCFAGAVCLQILKRRGIDIGAHILEIADVEDEAVDGVNVTPEELLKVKQKDFPVMDDRAGQKMIDAIAAAKADGDSVGGIVELCILGLPVGIGEPMFGGIENKLAQIVFGIPAVKGVEFGLGFEAARVRGSENNDGFYCGDDGKIRTRTNNHGGILGGMSSGMPVIMRTAFKPTPSIAKEQDSIAAATKEETRLRIKGRHDPCIVPRAVPCVEAAAAVAILDLILLEK